MNIAGDKNMKLTSGLLLVFILLLTTVVNATDVAVVPTSFRYRAGILLHELQVNPEAQRYPEELKSLAEIFAAAEKSHNDGNAAESERMYLLALMKGELLSGRLQSHSAAEFGPRVRTSPATELQSVFKPVSSSRVAEPAAVPVETVGETKEIPTEDQSAEISPDESLQVSSPRLVGGEGLYTVRKNDSMKLVASRLGVSLRELARVNRLKTNATLRIGQKLKYNNRRIVPKTVAYGIIVNIPDRNLYLFKGGRLSARYPVALGMAKKKDKTIWRTPTGKFRIIDKKENPTWTVPLSIQKEMEENGEEVLEVVPPGPRNPLGRHALKTSLGGILIHSTTRPTSINTYSSHGCIRVMPDNMAELFRSVTVSMPGEIIYQPVKVEVTDEGRVFLEVNQDVYEQFGDIQVEVERLLRRYSVSDTVSWNRVMQVINDRKGIAEEITLQ